MAPKLLPRASSDEPTSTARLTGRTSTTSTEEPSTIATTDEAPTEPSPGASTAASTTDLTSTITSTSLSTSASFSTLTSTISSISASASASATETSKPSDRFSPAGIAGIIISGLLGLAFLLGIALIVLRKRHHRLKKKRHSTASTALLVPHDRRSSMQESRNSRESVSMYSRSRGRAGSDVVYIRAEHDEDAEEGERGRDGLVSGAARGRSRSRSISIADALVPVTVHPPLPEVDTSYRSPNNHHGNPSINTPVADSPSSVYSVHVSRSNTVAGTAYVDAEARPEIAERQSTAESVASSRRSRANSLSFNRYYSSGSGSGTVVREPVPALVRPEEVPLVRVSDSDEVGK
ncbi:hypothetical protein M501DRAFT_988621 [Patellaria atrata CBS 101060]|uniref:Uncharacterized protein n=1 Tax=Patellaria atrata CBS 101060 TaxID=1346257 RepID=A0A9P4VSU3_9PEZI|nr:hypothetical protein M501DRAFT_988621 [Patellaria atrata CBS 101060]